MFKARLGSKRRHKVNKRSKEINDYLKKIIEKLKPADPYKIVLFGSYAKGTAKPDSDIDLMVLIDNDYIPLNHNDMLKIYSHVRDYIRDDEYIYGMDFKVFSRAEYKRLKDRDSFFIYEVEKTGETIYEKYH
jgi:predicted nucleotidyltransferase